MKNKKGFTLLEIIISVGLIAVVMLFLFQLLTDVSFEAEHPTYAKENQVIRASVMRKIQQDFISMPLADVDMPNEHTIRFVFKDGVNTIEKTLDLSETDINYDDESWSVKGNEVKIDFEHISIVKNSASESDLCREETNPDLNITEKHCPTYKSIKIKIPIINESEDNIIDDIELFYIGENTIFVPDYSARTYYLTLDAKTGTNIAVNRTGTSHEDVAPLGAITSGEAIYPDDQLTIITSAKDHYELTDVKVEGYEGFSKDNPSGSITVKGNVKVTANAKLKEYKLTLDARTGSEITVVRDSSLSGAASGRISNGATIYDGDMLTIYANPTNASQYNPPTIKVNNANFATATSYEVRGDTIVLAQTTPREYTLTKSQGTGTTLKITRTRSTIGNGAVNTTLENNATIYCDDFLEITADTTTGYKNAKITVNGETLSSNETKLVTGNTTISSSASPETYTISYNANGGSGAPANQTKTYNQELTLSSTKPTRSGHTFLGWAEASTATAATYQAGGKYTKNSATTLYAVWKVSDYTITWNANGGKVNGNSTYNTSVTIGSKLGTLPTATKSGSQFLGWFTNNKNDNPGSSINSNTVPTKNTTYYALWKTVSSTFTYSYTLKTNCSTGCTMSSLPSTTDHGTIYLVPGDTVSITCYNDRGSGTNFYDALSKNREPLKWYSGRSGSSTTHTFTYDGSQNGTWSCDKYYYEHGDLDYLQRNYQYVQQHAGYMGNDGSICYGQCDRVSFNVGSSYVIKWVDYQKTTTQIHTGGNNLNPPAQVSRDTSKYHFQGWYTGENGTGAKVDQNTKAPFRDVTYYAYWITLTGNTKNFELKTYRPSDLGNVTAKIGDKVYIYCYNERSLGSYKTVHLYHGSTIIGTGRASSGTATSTSFIYDGSQSGSYDCKVYFDDNERSWIENKSSMTLSTG